MENNILFAKIKAINTSDGIYNISVISTDKEEINLKANSVANLEIGHIYKFEIEQKNQKNYIKDFKKTSELEDIKEIDFVFRSFNTSNPYSLNELKDGIYAYVTQIKNEIIFKIVKDIIKMNEKKFFTYPAAQKLHHAYIGGLAYHTLSMLNLAKGFIKAYPYLSKDYLYAGIILHDIGKIKEFDGIENTQYTPNGQLIGHLVIGSFEIEEVARKYGYQDTEEVLVLKHMVLSHHGQPQFGAVKKPATMEALVLWYIDSIDSKLVVINGELNQTNEGEFTDQILVSEKTKFYKHK